MFLVLLVSLVILVFLVNFVNIDQVLIRLMFNATYVMLVNTHCCEYTTTVARAVVVGAAKANTTETVTVVAVRATEPPVANDVSISR